MIGEGAEDEEADAEETEIEKAHSRGALGVRARAEELLAQLIPEYVNISVYRALLESAASELGARMTAMRNAAENAETMMDDLTLEMNRVQAGGDHAGDPRGRRRRRGARLESFEHETRKGTNG